MITGSLSQSCGTSPCFLSEENSPALGLKPFCTEAGWGQARVKIKLILSPGCCFHCDIHIPAGLFSEVRPEQLISEQLRTDTHGFSKYRRWKMDFFFFSQQNGNKFNWINSERNSVLAAKPLQEQAEICKHTISNRHLSSEVKCAAEPGDFLFFFLLPPWPQMLWRFSRSPLKRCFHGPSAGSYLAPWRHTGGRVATSHPVEAVGRASGTLAQVPHQISRSWERKQKASGAEEMEMELTWSGSQQRSCLIARGCFPMSKGTF